MKHCCLLFSTNPKTLFSLFSVGGSSRACEGVSLESVHLARPTGRVGALSPVCPLTLPKAGLRSRNACTSSLVSLRSGEAVKPYWEKVMRLLNHIVTPHHQGVLRELFACPFISSQTIKCFSVLTWIVLQWLSWLTSRWCMNYRQYLSSKYFADRIWFRGIFCANCRFSPP